MAADRPATVHRPARVLRRSAALLRPHRSRMALAGVAIVAWTATVLGGPLLVGYAIDHGIRAGSSRTLNLCVAAYVVLAVVSYLASRAQTVLVGEVGEGFLRDLRARGFRHLLGQSMPFYDREKAGVVVSRLTSDVDTVGELVQQGLLLFLSNALLLVASLVTLALVSWELLVWSIAPLPLLLLATVKFQRDSNRAYLAVREHVGSVLSSLQEGLAGIRVVHAYNRQHLQVERFEATNQQLLDAHMDSVRVSVWYLPLVELCGMSATALAVGAGGWMVQRGEIELGTVSVFVLALSNLFEPVNQLSQLFNTVQSSGAGLEKVFGLLDTAPEVPEDPDPVDLPATGDLVLRGVAFAYDATAAPVLRDVDLDIAAGEKLALVGPTGAGKSTLAKLMARFYDPSQGTVTYGGVDLRRACARSLRSVVCVVPQEGSLFEGTLLDNVRLGRTDASDDEVLAAMASVGVLERFRSLPDGVHTEVQEGGSRLSAGERQLVSLARAALADPQVLILDEATSSLDPGSEAEVEAALEAVVEGRTVVVIAHRLTTVARADRIAVVADGGIAELGTHDELVARAGRYAALHATWMARMGPAETGGEGPGDHPLRG